MKVTRVGFQGALARFACLSGPGPVPHSLVSPRGLCAQSRSAAFLGRAASAPLAAAGSCVPRRTQRPLLSRWGTRSAVRLPGSSSWSSPPRSCPRRRRRRRPGASWSSSVRGRLPGAPERALCAPRWCSPPAGFRLPFAFCCSSQSSLGGPWGLPLGLERGPRFYCMPSLPLHLDSGPPQRHCHPPGQFRKEMKPKGHPPEVSVHPVCGSAGWGA